MYTFLILYSWSPVANQKDALDFPVHLLHFKKWIAGSLVLNPYEFHTDSCAPSVHLKSSPFHAWIKIRAPPLWNTLGDFSLMKEFRWLMSVFYFDSERVLNPKCAFSLSKQCELCCPRVKNGAKAIRCASSIRMSVIIAPGQDFGLINYIMKEL